MSTVSKKIFAQLKPNAQVLSTLYAVPENTQAKGTIYISASHQSHDRDYVSVGIVPATYSNNGILVSAPAANTWIMSSTEFFGTVSIYLQQICLNEGDEIKVSSEHGNCQFTYLGDLYTD